MAIGSRRYIAGRDWLKLKEETYEAQMRQSKAMALNTIGQSVSQLAGDSEKALLYYNQALSIFEKDKDQVAKKLTSTDACFNRSGLCRQI